MQYVFLCLNLLYYIPNVVASFFSRHVSHVFLLHSIAFIFCGPVVQRKEGGTHYAKKLLPTLFIRVNHHTLFSGTRTCRIAEFHDRSFSSSPLLLLLTANSKYVMFVSLIYKPCVLSCSSATAFSFSVVSRIRIHLRSTNVRSLWQKTHSSKSAYYFYIYTTVFIDLVR